MGGTTYIGGQGGIGQLSLPSGAVTSFLGHLGGSSTGCRDASQPSQVAMDSVSAMATDGHYLYFNDWGCSEVRRANLVTGATSLVVGGANYEALAYGANGNLYGFQSSGEVDQINPTQGTVTPYGQAPTAPYQYASDYVGAGDAVAEASGAGAYVAVTQYGGRSPVFALYYLSFGASPNWQQLASDSSSEALGPLAVAGSVRLLERQRAERRQPVAPLPDRRGGGPRGR